MKSRSRRHSNHTKRKHARNRTRRYGGRTSRLQTPRKGDLKSIEGVSCSMGRKKEDSKTASCYTDEHLYKLQHLWNMRHPDAKIMSNDPKKIRTELQKHLSGVCSTEACWLRQKFVDNPTAKQILKSAFAPEAPKSWKKNPAEWLSSVDIEKVMIQFEKAYPCFAFIGPSPIDYDTHMAYGECVWEELCKFDLESFVKKDKFKIGIIFNLDPHYKPGSHWVSLFINLRKGYIFYFDSGGDKAPKEVLRLVDTVVKQGKALGLDLKYIENTRGHQKEDNECGMYSLYAIAEQLRDSKHPAEFLHGGEITDHSMHLMRARFFSEPDSLSGK